MRWTVCRAQCLVLRAYSVDCASIIRLHLCAALHGNLSSYFWRIVSSEQCVLSSAVARAIDSV